jgi:nucleoside-diphosphate-sugar epimerase
MDREYTLITGSSGFIGSHVARRLSSDNRYALVAIVRNSGKTAEINALKEKGIIFVEGSFYDDSILDQVFRDFEIRNVIHIAAVRGAGHCTKEDYHKVNVRGTEILLRHAFKSGVEKFIFCSSVGVYGTIPSELPASLNTPLNGDNDYHSSKILAEEKVMEFVDKGLNAFIVRPVITYGTGDNGFLFTLMKLVRKRLLVLPFLETRIHLLDVDSLADFFALLLSAANLRSRIFIVGDREPVSMRELVNAIYHAFHGKRYPSFLKLPDIFFEFMTGLLHLIRADRWLVRLLLLSKDWSYDMSVTIAELGFRPADTLSRITVLAAAHEKSYR